MKYGLSNNVVSELQQVFSRHSNIERVVIFGSRSKGNYRAGSDIDLALSGEGLDSSELLDIGSEIDDLGLLYRVDLVNYDSKRNTPIGEHIGRVGQTFYTRA